MPEASKGAGSGGASHRERSRRTCQALIDAARQIIDEDGVDALTMGAVAERAGVSRRAVYLHFASRTALLSAVYRSAAEAEGLTASFQRVWRQPDASSALTAWARHVGHDRPDIVAACVPPAEGEPHCRPSDDVPGMDGYDACRRLATWLHREGRLASPWTVATAADMIWALSSLNPRLLRERGWSRERHAELLGALLRRTFVREGAAQG